MNIAWKIEKKHIKGHGEVQCLIIDLGVKVDLGRAIVQYPVTNNQQVKEILENYA